MVAYRKPQIITREEYLRQERNAETRSEYYDGIIVAMAGASPEHDDIVMAIAGELYTQLKGTDCRPRAENTRVWVPECNKYFYPDVLAICGEPDYETLEGVASLCNPTLIVEVLSRTTERTDRVEKQHCYKTLPSLQTYVLVAQERPAIEIYHRDPQSGEWLEGEVEGLEAELPLEAIGCTLKLADIYARITFPSR